MSKIITQNLENLITENRDVFFQELKQVIKPSFEGLENPQKYNAILSNTIEHSKRSSLLRQAQLVSAATEYLESKKNKSLIISAEMGAGKTDMAVKISLSNKLIPVYMVICPPHLVDTWMEELEANYRDPNAYKVIRVKRWEDIVPYAKRNLWNDGVKYYFIITRENLKLSYPKEVAVDIKHQEIETEQEIDGQTRMFKNIVKTACCPSCGERIVEENDNGYLNLSKVPRVCTGEVRTYRKDENGEEIYNICGAILRQPIKVDEKTKKEKKRRLDNRESIADYIFKNFTKGSYNVILDEMHEYKGGDTGQGNAMGRLVTNARKTIGLTGTLMNGKASSLFYLLYRLNPSLMKDTLGFNYNDLKSFVSKYGAFEETYSAKEVNIEGKVTRMGKRTSLKELPKINPHLLSVLLGMTIFLKLDEIKMPNNLQLPPYKEVVDLVDMEDELYYPYIKYIENIISNIRKNKALLGNLATDAIAIPDMPFIPRDAQSVCFYEPKITREEFGLTNKEKRLVENVRVELEQGRDCLVYITFSQQQVAKDLESILSDAFPDKKVLFLPSTVPPVKRKEWIKNNPSDVLICNPELVKTGLTLLNFVTIIFYETTYNVFTLKQASRRSWRIGQTEDIKVIFMAYRNTPQHKALELIGAKINAANSLEGRFGTEEDLSSMGEEDESIQLALARSILKGDTSSQDIKLTSIDNFGADREYNSFEMHYQSLLDDDSKLRKLEVEQVQMEVEVAIKEEQSSSLFDSKTTSFDEMFNDTKIIDEEVEATPAISNDITVSSMIKEFTKNILEHHRTGDFYGGVEHSYYCEFNKRMEISTSYVGAYQLFEINDDYKNGNKFGLAVSYKRDNKNQIVSIDINRVYHHGKVPFNQDKKVTSLNNEALAVLLQASNYKFNNLENLLNIHFRSCEITDDSLIRKQNITTSINEQTEEIKNSFVAIIGKGKKAKTIKVESANNLFDFMSDNIEITGTTGVQLAFDF